MTRACRFSRATKLKTTLTAMFNPTVQLPSGGYIVIGITEALVAIDIKLWAGDARRVD